MSASGPLRRATDGGKNNWRTPKALFDLLDDEYDFTLDGAADAENALCPKFYSEECDAFRQEPRGETIWLNPPYGNLKPWAHLVEAWREENDGWVLVPAASDTEWFKILYENCHELRLLYGRVKFINPTTGKPDGSNTTGSALFRFAQGPLPADPWFDLWDWRKDIEKPVQATYDGWADNSWLVKGGYIEEPENA